eukprot:gb/GECG01006207.1/.p1 GENE.gb/GECG01006207.1/~~gb/GECG01006207.1/.p1  ORF type:complete len:1776 (+),score=165.17 gb/GECG01006207.1/:1-5328(+)
MEDHPWRRQVSWTSTLPARWRELHRYTHFFMSPQQYERNSDESPMQRAIQCGTHLSERKRYLGSGKEDTPDMYRAFQECEQTLRTLIHSPRMDLTSWFRPITRAIILCCYDAPCYQLLTDAGVGTLGSVMDLIELIIEDIFLTNSPFKRLEDVRQADLLVRFFLSGLETLDQRVEYQTTPSPRARPLPALGKSRVPCSVEDARALVVIHTSGIAYRCVSALAFADGDATNDEYLKACIASMFCHSCGLVEVLLGRLARQRNVQGAVSLEHQVSASRETLVLHRFYEQFRILEKTSQKSEYASASFYSLKKVLQGYLDALSSVRFRVGEIQEDVQRSMIEPGVPLVSRYFQNRLTSTREISSTIEPIEEHTVIEVTEGLELFFQTMCETDKVSTRFVRLVSGDAGFITHILKTLYTALCSDCVSVDSASFVRAIRLCSTTLALHNSLELEGYFALQEAAGVARKTLDLLSCDDLDSQVFCHRWKDVFEFLDARMGNFSHSTTYEYVRTFVLLSSSPVYSNLIKRLASSRPAECYVNMLVSVHQTIFDSFQNRLSKLWRFCFENEVSQLVILADICFAGVCTRSTNKSLNEIVWAVGSKFHQAFASMGSSAATRFARIGSTLHNFAARDGIEKCLRKVKSAFSETRSALNSLSTMQCLNEAAETDTPVGQTINLGASVGNQLSPNFCVNRLRLLLQSTSVDDDLTFDERALKCFTLLEYLYVTESISDTELQCSGTPLVATIRECATFVTQNVDSMQEQTVDRMFCLCFLLVAKLLGYPQGNIAEFESIVWGMLEGASRCNVFLSPLTKVVLLRLVMELILSPCLRLNDGKIPIRFYLWFQKPLAKIHQVFGEHVLPLESSNTEGEHTGFLKQDVPLRYKMDGISDLLDRLPGKLRGSDLPADLLRIEQVLRLSSAEKLSVTNLGQLLKTCNLALLYSEGSQFDQYVTNTVFRVLDTITGSLLPAMELFEERMWNAVAETVFCNFFPGLLALDSSCKREVSICYSNAFYLRRVLVRILSLAPHAVLRSAMSMKMNLQSVFVSVPMENEFLQFIRSSMVPITCLVYRQTCTDFDGSTDELPKTDGIGLGEQIGKRYHRECEVLGMNLLLDRSLCSHPTLVAVDIYLNAPPSLISIQESPLTNADGSSHEESPPGNAQEVIPEATCLNLLAEVDISINHVCASLAGERSQRNPHSLLQWVIGHFAGLKMENIPSTPTASQALIRLRTVLELLLLDYLDDIHRSQSIEKDQHSKSFKRDPGSWVRYAYKLCMAHPLFYPLLSHINSIMGTLSLSNRFLAGTMWGVELLYTEAAHVQTLEGLKFLPFVRFRDDGNSKGHYPFVILKYLMQFMEVMKSHLISEAFSRMEDTTTRGLLYPRNQFSIRSTDEDVLDDRLMCIRYFLKLSNAVLSVIHESFTAFRWIWDSGKIRHLLNVVQETDSTLSAFKGGLGFLRHLSLLMVNSVSSLLVSEVVRDGIHGSAELVVDWFFDLTLQEPTTAWTSLAAGIQLRLLLETRCSIKPVMEKLYSRKYDRRYTFLRNTLDRMLGLLRTTQEMQQFEFKALAVESRFMPRRLQSVLEDASLASNSKLYEFGGWACLLAEMIKQIPSVTPLVLQKAQQYFPTDADNGDNIPRYVLLKFLEVFKAMGRSKESAKLAAGHTSFKHCISHCRRFRNDELLCSQMFETISSVIAFRESANFFVETMKQIKVLLDQCFQRNSRCIQLSASRCMARLIQNSYSARALCREELSNFVAARAEAENDGPEAEELKALYSKILTWLNTR